MTVSSYVSRLSPLTRGPPAEGWASAVTPTTQRLDGRGEGGGEGVSQATLDHLTPPSAMRTTPVCSVIKINCQKWTACLLFLHSLITHMQRYNCKSGLHKTSKHKLLLADLRKPSSYDTVLDRHDVCSLNCYPRGSSSRARGDAGVLFNGLI